MEERKEATGLQVGDLIQIKRKHLHFFASISNEKINSNAIILQIKKSKNGMLATIKWAYDGSVTKRTLESINFFYKKIGEKTNERRRIEKGIEKVKWAS